MTKNITNLGFTRVHFSALKPTSMQVLFHFLQLLPNFFGQVMHFYKSTWSNIIDTYFKFLQTFSSIVAYWHALEKKHD
jgi:hypothetical protein